MVAQDRNFNQLTASLNLTILGTSTAFKVLRKYGSIHQAQPVPYYYNCGERNLRISIDELFEGDRTTKLIVEDLNPPEL